MEKEVVISLQEVHGTIYKSEASIFWFSNLRFKKQCDQSFWYIYHSN